MKKISLCNLHVPLDVVELTFTGSRSTQTSGSAVQHPNHYTTEGFNRVLSHYKYDIGYRCKVLYMLTLVEHLSLL